jgi:hypothetical protein
MFKLTTFNKNKFQKIWNVLQCLSLAINIHAKFQVDRKILLVFFLNDIKMYDNNVDIYFNAWIYIGPV